MSNNVEINARPEPDQVLVDIADYICDYEISSTEAYDTARNCLMDTLGCGLLALRFPECTKLLGPLVEGTVVPNGARVPGTQFRLDPVKAAWDIGCIVRWLDYNDTWLAAEWGLPAALCLLVLVILIYVGGYRNIRKRGNRDRALRFGCLVASAIVPLHSLFDVPAHRPSLLLASLVLFVISQNHQAAPELAPKKWSRALGVVVGLCLITTSVLFLGATSFGWRKPLIVQSAEDLAQGAELYKKIKEEFNPLNPMQSLQMRKEAVEVSGQITRDLPLDGRLYRLRALASLPLIDRNEETAADFAIDRALIPFSIRIPKIHAAASLPYLDEEVAKGWEAALKNADRIDEIKGEESRERERVIGSIRSVVRKNPHLEAMALEVIGIEKFE